MDRIAVGESGVHDPFEEHATALPADRRDQEAQEMPVRHAVAAASRRMTAARMRLTNRVHRVGFVITWTS